MPDVVPVSEETKAKQSEAAQRRLARDGVFQHAIDQMAAVTRKRWAELRLKEAAALGFNVAGQADVTEEQRRILHRVRRRVSRCKS